MLEHLTIPQFCAALAVLELVVIGLSIWGIEKLDRSKS